MLPILLGVTLVGFILARVVPGDPALMVAGEQAPDYVVERLRAQMGLDRPVWVQYLLYLKDLARGDLGFAWHTGHPVARDLAVRFPATFELTVVSLLMAAAVAIPAGIVSATRRGSSFDHASRLGALVGASMPIFWLGLMLIYVLYFVLRIAPAPMGRLAVDVPPPTPYTGMILLDSLLSGDWAALRSAVAHIALPALCLSTGSMAILSRMVRSSMLEVLGEDYIRTARAKGLAERVVIYRHALKNALIPTVTVVGLQFGYLLGGAVVTETVFAWPGMGRYATESILFTDYAPIQGLCLLAAFVYAATNLVVDVLYAALDPRIRYR
jgi:peptide/nickel transport system permease protein